MIGNFYSLILLAKLGKFLLLFTDSFDSTIEWNG